MLILHEQSGPHSVSHLLIQLFCVTVMFRQSNVYRDVLGFAAFSLQQNDFPHGADEVRLTTNKMQNLG